MIMQAIRNEHSTRGPLYMLGEHWFKGYPGVGMLTNKIGLVAAHPANAHRLLHDEGRLVLVFPEGQKGTRKLFWQRYKLRRFGRGGFVKTAIRAGVPIVPVAVVGAEEAMPIFAHVPLLQRLTGLIYFPINHAFPHFGLLAAGMYMPAKFKIRFLEPVELDRYGPDAADDVAFVQQVGGRHPRAHPDRAERDAARAQLGLVRLGGRNPARHRALARPPDRIGSASGGEETDGHLWAPTTPHRGAAADALRAVLAFAFGSLVLAAACGESDNRNQNRPPVPINISVQLGPKKVTASPAKFGAGPITLLVANQSGASQIAHDRRAAAAPVGRPDQPRGHRDAEGDG